MGGWDLIIIFYSNIHNESRYLAHGSVILVTFNVRLGLFGFAALDQLRKENPTGTSGNYGMMDQRAALVWVQKSISSFGGDPSLVTIFGESSGGTSVAYHVVNPKSAGLFKRVSTRTARRSLLVCTVCAIRNVRHQPQLLPFGCCCFPATKNNKKPFNCFIKTNKKPFNCLLKQTEHLSVENCRDHATVCERLFFFFFGFLVFSFPRRPSWSRQA